MAVRNTQPNRPKESVVALAILALDGNASPLDMDMKGIGELRTDLDLALPGKPAKPHAAEMGRLVAGPRGGSSHG